MNKDTWSLPCLCTSLFTHLWTGPTATHRALSRTRPVVLNLHMRSVPFLGFGLRREVCSPPTPTKKRTLSSNGFIIFPSDRKIFDKCIPPSSRPEHWSRTRFVNVGTTDSDGSGIHWFPTLGTRRLSSGSRPRPESSYLSFVGFKYKSFPSPSPSSLCLKEGQPTRTFGLGTLCAPFAYETVLFLVVTTRKEIQIEISLNFLFYLL